MLLLKNNSKKHELFTDLLEQASVNTLTSLLSAKSRWRLTLEILLGHAPIKGGRTRDFPFSTQREKNTALSLLLIEYQYEGFIPGANKKMGRNFSQYDLIIAMMLLDIAEENCHTHSIIDEELHYSIAIRALINEIFTETDPLEITTLLGISNLGCDANCSIKNHVKSNLRFAKVMAVIAQEARNSDKQTADEIKVLFDIKEGDITRLEKNSLDLIISKTKKVQHQLNRCKQPFIQRGMSYWCSQILSRTRDCIKNAQTASTFILTDCDSVTIQVLSSSIEEDSLHNAIRDQFVDNNDHLSEKFIHTYYPRLHAYYESAKQQGINTDSVLPPIGNVILEKRSLLQLCTDYSYQSTFEPISYDDHIISFSDPIPSNSGYPCSGMYGDESLKNPELSVPYWFNKQKDEMYGWASTLLSLVGMSYHQATNNALARYLSESTGKKITVVNKHKQLIEYSGKDETHITYIKFDGDKVGKLFTSLSTLCRPALGIKLESLIRDSLLETLSILCKQEELSYTPIDLLYFGGDDLFIAIPSNQATLFLTLFDQELSNNQVKLNLELMFSFIAVSIPMKYKTQKLPDGSFIESKVLAEINALLGQVKERKTLCGEIARHSLEVEEQIIKTSIKGTMTKLV